MNDQSAKCPVAHGSLTNAAASNYNWWLNSLNLEILHQHDTKVNPLGTKFNYREEFDKLDVAAWHGPKL